MSLATMNWRRGLLRLWAVAAVLWVGVAFYSNDTVQRVRDAYEKVVQLNTDAELCLKLQTPSFTPDACSRARQLDRLAEGIRRADAAGDTAAVVVLGTEYRRLQAVSKKPLVPVDDWTPVGPSAAAPVAPRDLLAARPWENDPIVSAAAPLKPSIWPPLFDFAKLAFIPPLLLLALGYIGLWVGRGFRR